MQINIEQDVSLALIAAICGLAFPIIIQTIGQIDTKYGSTRLIERIKRSWQFYFFITSLIVAIIVRVYYCFAPERIADYGNFNSLVDNSALILVYSTLLILITSLFLFTFLVIKYYSPTKLLRSISQQMMQKRNDHIVSNRTDNKNGLFPKESKYERHFKDWTDLVISVISSPNYETVNTTALTAYESLYNYVAIYNKNLAYRESIYPLYFYNSIRSINRAICSQEQQLSSAHNSNIVVKIFVDDFQKTRISAPSYSCIWMCLSEQLHHNRTDLIIEYWTAAYQHYSMFLNRICVGDVQDRGMSTERIITAEDVTNRDLDRKQFKFFNCALGALTLYHKKHTFLNDIFKYKNSTYEFNGLIPDNYSEIIAIYLEINNFNIADPFWIERQYPFMNIRGVNSSNEIKFWIEKYLVTILVRTEILAQTEMGSWHTEMPPIPRTLSDLHFYREQLDKFKKIIGIAYQDKFIEDLYPNHPSSTLFGDKIDDYISKINIEYDRIKKEQEMNQDMVDSFYQSIKEQYAIFKSKIKLISDAKTGNAARPYICDLKIEKQEYEDKGVFCINQDIGWGNYNSVFSSELIHNIELKLGQKLFGSNINYLNCKYDDLFNALDSLAIDDNFIVITNKVEFEYFRNKGVEMTYLNEELSIYSYKNIPIVNFQHLKDSKSYVWILRKSELPTFSFEKDPSNKKYTKDIKILNDGLFANVIDLFRSDHIRKSIKGDNDIETKILIWVECNLKISWIKDIQVLGLRLLYNYHLDIILNDDETIKPFNEYFK